MRGENVDDLLFLTYNIKLFIIVTNKKLLDISSI